jgi:hypothetical protein
LFEERLRRVKLKGQSWFTERDCGRFLAHLFPLEVALQRVKEKAVMRNAIPVKDLLLLLGPDAVVLVEKVEKRALRLFQRCIRS